LDFHYARRTQHRRAIQRHSQCGRLQSAKAKHAKDIQDARGLERALEKRKSFHLAEKSALHVRLQSQYADYMYLKEIIKGMNANQAANRI